MLDEYVVKPVTNGCEELDLGDEHSSLKPIIDRKLTPSPEPSPSLESIHPVKGGFLDNTARRLLPPKRGWRTAICSIVGLLSVPFYVLCGFARHYHDHPVESKDQSGILNSFGNKVRDISKTYYT